MKSFIQKISLFTFSILFIYSFAHAEAVNVILEQSLVSEKQKTILKLKIEKNRVSIAGMTYTVLYDVNTFIFQDIVKTELTTDAILRKNDKNGTLRFGFITIKDIKSTGDLFEVIFLKKQKNTGKDLIELKNAQCSDISGNMIPVHIKKQK
jgi:hypothetical protein